MHDSHPLNSPNYPESASSYYDSSTTRGDYNSPMLSHNNNVQQPNSGDYYHDYLNQSSYNPNDSRGQNHSATNSNTTSMTITSYQNPINQDGGLFNSQSNSMNPFNRLTSTYANQPQPQHPPYNSSQDIFRPNSTNLRGTSSSFSYDDSYPASSSSINSSSNSSLFTIPPPPVPSASNARVMDYAWAEPLIIDYKPGILENGLKMVIFFEILEQTLLYGDKLLVFSHSLFTLDIIEQFLSQRFVPTLGASRKQKWSKNVNYYRIDGSTSAVDREKLINNFNGNEEVKLFLLSTRAGCLGINLIGANRIIVMDASWNPCHDAQAACRIYRYGQQKECYIYRMICDDSLEKRIYDRQVTKQEISHRVVDELNPETNFTRREIDSLIDDLDNVVLAEAKQYTDEECNKYEDPIIRYLCKNLGHCLSKPPFEHESLLLDRKETKLSTLEKKIAEENYLALKKQLSNGPSSGVGVRYSSLPYNVGIKGSPIRTLYNPPPIQGQSNPYNWSDSSQGIPGNFMGPRVSDILNRNCRNLAQFSSLPSHEFAERLREIGYSVKTIKNPTDFQVLTGEGRQSATIPKNTELLLLKGPDNDCFIRTPEGKMFNIKSDLRGNNTGFLNIPRPHEAVSIHLIILHAANIRWSCKTLLILRFLQRNTPPVIDIGGSPPSISRQQAHSFLTQPRNIPSDPEIIFLDDD